MTPAGAGRPAAKTRVRFVNFEHVLRTSLQADPREPFDRRFYSGARWPARPNSTSRLMVVNYLAWQRLGPDFDIEVVHAADVTSMDDLVSGCDVLVINQVASAASREFVLTFTQFMRTRAGDTPAVVFGTEMTWFSELAKGTIDEDVIDYVYRRALLLRHTARTDRPVYGAGFGEARVQEFEIGIDTSVVAPTRPITERDTILLVKAPEGRSTKNNEGVTAIVEQLARTPSLAHLNVAVLEPPYSSPEYWQMLEETKYLIMTSLGETFSYVYNDARAMGVISYRRREMHKNFARDFTLDSYPDSYGAYSTPSELVEQIGSCEQDANLAVARSQAARQYVEQNFSVPAVATDWSTLLSGGSLNNRSMLVSVADGGPDGMARLFSAAAERSCPYVLVPGNEAVPNDYLRGASHFDETSGVTLIADHLVREGSGWRQFDPYEDRGRAESCEADVDLAARFLRLASRIYKVDRLVLTERTRLSRVVQAAARVRVTHGFDTEPLVVTVVPR